MKKNIHVEFYVGVFLGALLMLCCTITFVSFTKDKKYSVQIENTLNEQKVISYCLTSDSVDVKVVTNLKYENKDSLYVSKDIVFVDSLIKNIIQQMTYNEYLYDIRNGGNRIINSSDSLYDNNYLDILTSIEYHQ